MTKPLRKTTPERPALEVVFNEKEIASLLLRLGFQPNMHGYHYTLFGIKIILQDPMRMINGMCNSIYPSIAKEFDTTPSRAERGIRFSIEQAHELKTESWQELVVKNHPSDKKPTNSWFLATMAELIRLRMVS